MFTIRGNGYLILLCIPILWAVRGLTNHIQDDPHYFQEHPGPQTLTFFLCAFVIWSLHTLSQRRRVVKEIDEDTGEPIFPKEDHSFFAIPIQYWPWILAVLAIPFPYAFKIPSDFRDVWKSSDFRRALEDPVAPQPSLFARSILLDPMDQRDSTLSSDQRHFLYTLQASGTARIIHLYDRGRAEGWTVPSSASFSGQTGGGFRDLEPAFRPGTTDLYFASDRPLPGETEAGDFNLWTTSWNGQTWTTPRPLHAVNGEDNEFYPSLAADGTLFFTARRDDGIGGEDLWMCLPDEQGFHPPRLVPGALNTTSDEFNAAVHPDGTLIAFGSARPDGPGGGDLYFSRLRDDGTWSAGVLGPEGLNTEKLDFCPFFQPDSEILWFTSSRAEIAPAYLEQDALPALRKRWDERGAGGQDLYRMRYDRDTLFDAAKAAKED